MHFLGLKLSLCIGLKLCLSQGVFLPVFKKLKASFKKTSSQFWPKTQSYGDNFEYHEKNSKCFDRNIQNLFKSSWDFQQICRIFQVLNQFLWNFSKNTQWIFQKNLQFLRNSRNFPKNQEFEKNSKFWRQCASGCLPKIGQKKAL